MRKVVIIGNGISGITAAIELRKRSQDRIIIISEEGDYFFARTGLMYVFMGHLQFKHLYPYERDFWSKQQLELLQQTVIRVDTEGKLLELADGSLLPYDILVIACGSKPNKFGWPGQDLAGVTGLYHRQDLDRLEQWVSPGARGVIVGGGLIGIELAEMLLTRQMQVTFLVREKSFWDMVLPPGESALVNRHIREHGIDLRLETGLIEIFPDAHGRAKAVLTSQDQTIDCSLVGLTAGVSPDVAFLNGSGIDLAIGILVNRYLETNLPDVYAIGDCTQQTEPYGRHRPIEAVWYTARMMGETVARTIAGERTPYEPGPWFNSAKFLDIEYQTYGNVSAQPANHEVHCYWEHPRQKIGINLSYDRFSRQFLGINTLGIRMRHTFFDQVLKQEKSIDYVVQHLREANFDPEFYTHYEHHLVNTFNITNVQIA